MSYNVLLIDDETAFAGVLEKRLGKRGLSVRVAHDGPTGLEMLKEWPAEVVILDMRMPGMDGMQTLEAIHEARHDVEVIFLTGHADTNAAMAGLDKGAFDYCLKPIDIDTLYDKIEDAHTRRTLRDKS